MNKFFDDVYMCEDEHADFEKILSGWVSLSKVINTMSERSLKRALLVEIRGKARQQIMYRLKTRFNTLRNLRENMEIIRG